MLLLFIAVPLLEMLLLFEVADLVGGLWTIGLVVLTAVIGVQILKLQGFSTLLRVNQRLHSGELPAQEIVEGVLLACAGALLLTPGFITDSLGFALLTTPLRRALAARVIRSGWFLASGQGGGVYWSSHSRYRETDGRIYEGELDPEDERGRPPLDSPAHRRRP
jgi:UPF0716 protein FxsA